MSDPYHLPPPIEETPPISSRTDESLVRAIAEWMGLNIRISHNGLVYETTGGGDPDYDAHFDPATKADDRERVKIASGMFYQHIVKHGLHFWSIYDMGKEEAYQAWHSDSGRAFIVVQNQWIEAQETGHAERMKGGDAK